MRPDGMWIWILYCIFVYHKLHQVARFEKTYTYTCEVNSKTKKGIHATVLISNRFGHLPDRWLLLFLSFGHSCVRKTLKIIHSKPRTLWFDLVSEIFWLSCRKNTSASPPPTQWSSSIHHLSFKPLIFLVLSSHNPLVMGKCISLTFPCTEHVFEFYNTLLISWNFGSQGRWTSCHSFVDTRQVAKLLHRYTFIHQFDTDWCISHPELQGILHGPVWEYRDLCCVTAVDQDNRWK